MKKTKNSYIEAFGRRKESTARVRLYSFDKVRIVNVGSFKLKKGDILVNGKTAEEYFPGAINKIRYQIPLKATNNIANFAAVAKVAGGGIASQLDAVIHGLAKALEKEDKEKNRPILRKKGLLTRDARVKERRKAGLAQKARAKKQSPKR